jgi:low affinity Fe/Cu permease
MQVKLDELIRNSRAKNRFVGIEHLSDDELEQLRLECEARAKLHGDQDRPRPE